MWEGGRAASHCAGCVRRGRGGQGLEGRRQVQTRVYSIGTGTHAHAHHVCAAPWGAVEASRAHCRTRAQRPVVWRLTGSKIAARLGQGAADAAGAHCTDLDDRTFDERARRRMACGVMRGRGLQCGVRLLLVSGRVSTDHTTSPWIVVVTKKILLVEQLAAKPKRGKPERNLKEPACGPR